MRLRVLLAALVLTGCGASVPGEHRPSAPAAPAPTASGGRDPIAVLHAWDAARAEAWAAGDAAALTALYAPGSVAGRRDVAALGRWTGRGFTVHGLRMQVLRVRVLVDQPDVLRLDVLDRLAGAEARSAGVVRRLPAGAPVRRTVALEKRDGRWVVRAVRPWRPSARP